MLTRCPECKTHFRVTPEQLKARAGRVRCGDCQNVFNALDTLIEEPVVVMAPSTNAADHPPFPEPARAADIAIKEEIAVSPAPTPELPIDVTGAAGGIAGEFVPEAVLGATEAAPGGDQGDGGPDGAACSLSDTETPLPDTPAPAAAPDQIAMEMEPWADHEPKPRRWPWVLGAIAAMLALGIQAVIAFRVELAVLWPQLRPVLVEACALAGCETGLPAKVGLVGIESSDLHPDASQKGRLALVASLKNRAPFAQAYPHLELTLTDTSDKAIVRKVLAPADYLSPAKSIATGMPPGADIAINIALDAGELPASGYRLYIFYP